LGVDGAYFFIGERRPKEAGKRERYLYGEESLDPNLRDRTLILRVNDDAPGNGWGSFTCHVRVFGVPRPRPRRPRLRATPGDLPLGKVVTVTVLAEDPETAAALAGTVKVNGAAVAPTGSTFAYTFRTRPGRVFDPASRTWVVEDLPPAVKVS